MMSVDSCNDDSDLEVLGVDMDDDEEIDEQKLDQKVPAVEHDNDTVAVAAGKTTDDAEEDSITNALAVKEAAELEAARKERLELIKAEQEAIKMREREATDPQSRLDYLLLQSDVFAHFLAGSVAATKKKKGGKGKAANDASKGGRSGQQRLTEEEEDEQLLKSAQSERHSVVRLHHQPSILAPICTMHPYQLEGLNWMIKLHDHGINGILADGTSSVLR